jgi:glycosyltransferase involved in cell wall biosynthesis
MDRSPTQPPAVSVVVPCLNRAHFLIPTIESILRQDYPRIECLVIDGGSTDGTLELLRRYDGRLRWVSEPDRGHADAINKGWRMSRGEILAWLNADDCWVVPDTVSQAVAYLQANPEASVVYGQSAWIDRDGRVVGPGYWKPWDLTYAVERCFHCIPQPAAFLRRRIVEQVGWLDTAFVSKKDHELWLRIGLVGTIRHVPVVWAYERACPGYLAKRGDITAHACVALTEKFFTLPNVPLVLQRRRRVALSGAYLRAAQLALIYGRHYRLALAYASRGLWLHPWNLHHGIRWGLRQVAERLHGLWRRALRRIVRSQAWHER